MMSRGSQQSSGPCMHIIQMYTSGTYTSKIKIFFKERCHKGFNGLHKTVLKGLRVSLFLKIIHFCLFACIYTCVPDVHGDQKEGLDPVAVAPM